MSNSTLPTGTVTFLFTDIEGSTSLWQEHPSDMPAALAQHHVLLREAIEAQGGYVFQIIGDAVCAAFATAEKGLEAALAAQLSLGGAPWGETGPIRVRMALHSGPAGVRFGEYTSGEYVSGLTLSRAARLLSAGHGGQILLSLSAAELVRDFLPGDVILKNMGERRLKDLIRAETIYQVISPDLPSVFPPLKTLDEHPNNLPVQLTSFVGREKEMAQVKELLDQERLLSLTGPGGSGKTRLALQIAAELTDEFLDGIFFVRLAPIRNPNLVIRTIAQTLGLQEQGKRTMLDTLIEYLDAKKILLLLNNFEHVIPAAPDLTILLSACMQVKLLITSREALHLRGEFEFPVQPLALPDLEHMPPLEILSAVPAVELFAQRAQAVQSGFSLTDENGLTVSEICTRLDGLPLAIELAAARIKLFPPGALLNRLVKSNGRASLHWLTGGARDAPERHRTLRATIEWSYDLLDNAEQWLFRSLSLFAGGFTLQAAEAVCCPPTDHFQPGRKEEPDYDVMEGVASLLDKSLLRHETGEEDEPRFTMLEMIRDYALDKLVESGQEENRRERHADYFLNLALEAKPMLRGPHQKAWFERLESEHNNLRTALDWILTQAENETALASTAAESGLRMAAALWRFWDTHGYVSEGRRWLERALAVGEAPINERVDVMNGAAYLAMRQADMDESIQIYEESLTLARKLGYKQGIAEALQGLGYLYEVLGDDDELMESLFAESLTLWREVGDKHGIAQALGPMAHLAASRYDFELATGLFEESLELFREVGDQREIAGALWNLGEVAFQSGDYDLARDRYEESLEIYRDLSDLHGIATQLKCLGEVECVYGNTTRAISLNEEGLVIFREIGDKACSSDALIGLGKAALCQEDFSKAISSFEESLLIYQEIGNRQGVARALRLLGLGDLACGDPRSARKHLCESLEMESETGNIKGIAACLDGMAQVAINHSDYGRSARLFSAAKALRASLGISLPPVDCAEIDKGRATAQAELDEAAFEAAQAEGRFMKMDLAIEYALDARGFNG